MSIDHFREAERLIRVGTVASSKDMRPEESFATDADVLAAAQVHATLALADQDHLRARIDAALALCDEVADVNGVPHVADKFRRVLTGGTA